jgi:hypothetical protein
MKAVIFNSLGSVPYPVVLGHTCLWNRHWCFTVRVVGTSSSDDGCCCRRGSFESRIIRVAITKSSVGSYCRKGRNEWRWHESRYDPTSKKRYKLSTSSNAENSRVQPVRNDADYQPAPIPRPTKTPIEDVPPSVVQQEQPQKQQTKSEGKKIKAKRPIDGSSNYNEVLTKLTVISFVS